MVVQLAQQGYNVTVSWGGLHVYYAACVVWDALMATQQFPCANLYLANSPEFDSQFGLPASCSSAAALMQDTPSAAASLMRMPPLLLQGLDLDAAGLMDLVGQPFRLLITQSCNAA